MRPTKALSLFQDAFVQALLQPDAQAPAPQGAMAAIAAQPGFAVYRNTVMKGWIDALAANFPAVVRVVGDEWLRAAAALYPRAHPPDEPALIGYGEGFPDFLAEFEHARAMPYLAGVARLDRYWTEAHIAHDQVPVHAGALQGHDRDGFERIALVPHCSARWIWFEGEAVVSLWRLSRSECDPSAEAEIEPRSQGVLIVRPAQAVENHDLGRAGIAFLDACAGGESILAAGLAALAVDPDADLSALLATLLAAGAFGAVRSIQLPPEE